MIVCPNCSHSNPSNLANCEVCSTPLPAINACPNCGVRVQASASFCGQCGFDLRVDAPNVATKISQANPKSTTDSLQNLNGESVGGMMKAQSQARSLEPQSTAPPAITQVYLSESTQIQITSARLLHVQTETVVEFPQGLVNINIGKPNDRLPPDIDVAGFPDAEVVSRVHATVRIEAGTYYIEDAGSSNGTYINNMPLPQGNRHRLRHGDRIALGKEDRVSFIFQRLGSY